MVPGFCKSFMRCFHCNQFTRRWLYVFTWSQLWHFPEHSGTLEWWEHFGNVCRRGVSCVLVGIPWRNRFNRMCIHLYTHTHIYIHIYHTYIYVCVCVCIYILIAKFRLKLKKVGKTTRPFRYDLNQIPYDHTVEVRNRFKGLDLIDRVPDELWMEVCDIVLPDV